MGRPVRQERALVNVFWCMVLLASLAMATAMPLYTCENDRRGEARQRQAELDRLYEECREMAVLNQGLRQRIRALQEDPRYLETTARAELGWVRERELLYH
ncbi:MAG: hypothetical protein FJ125_15310, partial [Deltaproteobacteria bacterium]|nr:hypothetical protein [Deltaproteobacteria bacterium]